MSTVEERMKILEMIQASTITPDEGAQLLQALHTPARKGAERVREPRFLKVRVTDLRTNKTRVNVTLPMSLVNVGIKLGARFIPADSGADLQGVIEAIQGGQTGKIFDHVDEAYEERVEIWVE